MFSFRSWCYTVYLRIVNAQATWASRRENQETFKYLVEKYDEKSDVQKKDACLAKALEMRQRCHMVVSEMENSGYNTELHQEKNAQQAQRKKDRKEFEGFELPDPLTVLPGISLWITAAILELIHAQSLNLTGEVLLLDQNQTALGPSPW